MNMFNLIYDPTLPKPRPRGFYVPVRGVWFKMRSPTHRAARAEMKAERRARRNKQWKENADREAMGEFVADPTSVFPAETQRRLHARGKWRSDFWRQVYKNFGSSNG
ncbi:hypothetical protein N9937_01290 [bacterium]|nr:hypothetical protein [bacterium]